MNDNEERIKTLSEILDDDEMVEPPKDYGITLHSRYRLLCHDKSLGCHIVTVVTVKAIKLSTLGETFVLFEVDEIGLRTQARALAIEEFAKRSIPMISP